MVVLSTPSSRRMGVSFLVLKAAKFHWGDSNRRRVGAYVDGDQTQIPEAKDGRGGQEAQ